MLPPTTDDLVIAGHRMSRTPLVSANFLAPCPVPAPAVARRPGLGREDDQETHSNADTSVRRRTKDFIIERRPRPWESNDPPIAPPLCPCPPPLAQHGRAAGEASSGGITVEKQAAEIRSDPARSVRFDGIISPVPLRAALAVDAAFSALDLTRRREDYSFQDERTSW